MNKKLKKEILARLVLIASMILAQIIPAIAGIIFGVSLRIRGGQVLSASGCGIAGASAALFKAKVISIIAAKALAAVSLAIVLTGVV